MVKHRFGWNLPIVAVIIIIAALGYIYMSDYSLKDGKFVSNEAACESQTQEHFEGKVLKIRRYLYNNYKNKHFFEFIISSDSKKDSMVYYMLPLHRYAELKDCTGVHIKKERGNDYFIITFANGVHKQYKVPDCLDEK